MDAKIFLPLSCKQKKCKPRHVKNRGRGGRRKKGEKGGVEAGRASECATEF